MALTQVDQGLLGTYAQYTDFKNRIINGSMMIDQRNAGASVSINTAPKTYTLDRWQVNGQPTDGVFTVQQSSTAPAGFTNSLNITVTTADSSLGASQYYLLCQRVEGYNVADLNWGSANAATVTLSFKVRSSVTGTFGGAIENSAEDTNYPFTYTISSANTWTNISVTIPGPTTGTWLTTNGIGMFVWFGLGVGTDLSATAGAWGSGTKYSATGATNLMATNGATFYITGVQLEKGSTATSFDYRPYGTELALCQRYYQKLAGYLYGPQVNAAGNGSYVNWIFKQEMRAVPTITYVASNYNGTSGTTTGYTDLYATNAGSYVWFGTGSSASAEL